MEADAGSLNDHLVTHFKRKTMLGFAKLFSFQMPSLRSLLGAREQQLVGSVQVFALHQRLHDIAQVTCTGMVPVKSLYFSSPVDDKRFVIEQKLFSRVRIHFCDNESTSDTGFGPYSCGMAKSFQLRDKPWLWGSQ